MFEKILSIIAWIIAGFVVFAVIYVVIKNFVTGFASDITKPTISEVKDFIQYTLTI